MRPILPDLDLTGAQILRPQGLVAEPLGIVAGRICERSGPFAGAVDLSGYLILPGIVDLHGPSPHRPPVRSTGATAGRPELTGLGALDRMAAAAGVTTCHLVQGWGWQGGTLGPEAAEQAMQAVAAWRVASLVDLRVKPCVEVRHPDATPRLMAAISRFGLHYAALQDSLEPVLALHRQNTGAFARHARDLGLTVEDLLARSRAAQGATVHLPANLRALSNGFDVEGVRFGSLGDPDAETREYHAMIGARIAEFPRSRRAAMAARSVGDVVLLSAPEMLRDPDGLAATLTRDLLRDGGPVALASGGDLPSLVAAACHAADQGWCSLATAWAAISTVPARGIGLKDRGQIAPGLRADLVILHERTRRIDAVLCDGRLVHLRSALRGRFHDLGPARLAAQ